MKFSYTEDSTGVSPLDRNGLSGDRGPHAGRAPNVTAQGGEAAAQWPDARCPGVPASPPPPPQLWPGFLCRHPAGLTESLSRLPSKRTMIKMHLVL